MIPPVEVRRHPKGKDVCYPFTFLSHPSPHSKIPVFLYLDAHLAKVSFNVY